MISPNDILDQQLPVAGGRKDSPATSDQQPATPVRCAHCLLPVPAGLIDAGAEHQFCCAGCRAVWETLHSCGLDGYYQLRQAAEGQSRPPAPGDSSYESFDSPTFEKLHVQRHENGLCAVDLVLEGVTCAACVWLIEKLPRVLDGVIDARLSLQQRTVRVTWQSRTLPLSRIARTLHSLGYIPHPARTHSARSLHQKESRKRLIHIGVAGAIMGNVMLLALALYAGQTGDMEPKYVTFFRWLSLLLGGTALAWPGATFFRSAWASLRLRSPNLDVPIALALLTGGVAGTLNVLLGRGEIYFDSLTVLVFLLLVGRFVQYQQQRRAEDSLQLLFSLTPSTAHVVRDGNVIDAPVEALQAGDIVEVRAGEILPADGIVESGGSTVNQALLTGESRPVSVAADALVHAGSQNVDGVLRVRVERVGQETRVGQLMRLIERGIEEKPKIVQFADRVGAWFVVIVSLAAGGTFFYWLRFGMAPAIDHAVALLIVTCPCVLGLATPLTVAAAIGRLARADILVKSGAALERLSHGGQLLLDKTGTITEGRHRLIAWEGPESLQPIVHLIEQRSSHPVGRALASELANVDEAPQPSGTGVSPVSSTRGPSVSEGPVLLSDLTESGDGGISARVNGAFIRIGSPSYMRRHNVAFPEALLQSARRFERSGATSVVIAIDNHATALAALGDRVRDDSRTAIESLASMGLRAALLSGDAADVVSAVAQDVGIAPDHAHGQMTPEQKLAFVKSGSRPEAQRRAGSESPLNSATIMVGDGVNDGAALAAADVGIAVHGGAEASLAAADVYIARPGLTPLLTLFHAARHTMRVIRGNLAVSLAYNLLAGTLAACGLMSPLIAAILMPLSSVTVLALAMLLIRRCGKPS